MRLRRSTRVILVVGVVALAWRVVYVLVWGRDPLVFGDGLFYHLQGQDLADGKGFIQPISYHYLLGLHPTAQHPPLFSLLLAAVTRSGRAIGLGSFDTTIVHQLTCACVSSVGVVVIGLLARKVANPRAGIAAAVVAAAYPALWVSDALVMSETLVVLTTALLLLAVFAYHDAPTARQALLLGAASGVAMLTRSEAGLLVVAIAVPIVLLVRTQSWRLRLQRLAVVLGVTALLLAPWTIRNVTTFDRVVLLSENAYSVIGGANCPDTYNGSGIGSWEISCNTWRLPPGDESVQGAELRHRGVQYALHHAGKLPVVALARVGRTFEVFRPFDDENDAGRFRWTEVANVVLFFPMQALAVIGLRRLRRAGRIIWPFVATLVATVVTVALTYGITRFRVQWDVVTAVLAGIAIAGAAVRPERAPAAISRERALAR